MKEEPVQKFEWKTMYTLVLVANAVYFLLFYFLMNSFS
jgi:hypothetical protein